MTQRYGLPMPQHHLEKNAGRHERIFMDTSGIGAYRRYLAAKKSIDDRAMNHHVWQTLHQVLPVIAAEQPLRIIEIGAGIGTMLARAVERALFTGPATYVATDRDPDQLRAARQYLSHWAAGQGHDLKWTGEDRCRLRSVNTDALVVLRTAGAEALADRLDPPGPYHLLIAHAVLDLIDVPALLPKLLQRLTPDGLALLTCNFDGDTIFLPECEHDQAIIQRYHASMDARIAGASHTGRRLLVLGQHPGLAILAAGSSDWVIHPINAGYSPDERYFLHAIIETVEQELGSRKDDPPTGLDTWARLRHRQVEAGELSFLARNLDLLVRCRTHGA